MTDAPSAAPPVAVPVAVMREIPLSPPPPARPVHPPGTDLQAAPDPSIARLTSHDPDARVAAARELGRRGDPASAVAPLVEALSRDVHPAVRIAAANALGKLHDERAINDLAAALADDHDVTVQAAARGALQGIGTRRALDAIAADDGRRARLASAAAERASAVDRTRGVEGLIEGFRSDHPRAQDDAADALAEAGPAAVDAVTALLRDENVWVRTRAAALLGRIGDARAAEPLAAAIAAISGEDRSFETYQFRDAAQRALRAVIPAPASTPASTFANAPGPAPVPLPSTDEATSAPPPPQDLSGPANPLLANLSEPELGQRLLEIARAALGGGRPPLDDYNIRRAAARAIGEEFHRRGGLEAMRSALNTHVGTLPGRHPIDQAWDGIGDWVG